VIVISDLYAAPDDVIKGLRYLSSGGNEVLVFQVLDPVELQFDFKDPAQFVDMETDASMHIIPEYVRQKYCTDLKKQIEEYERECRKDRMDFALIETSVPLDQALFRYLVRRQQLY